MGRQLRINGQLAEYEEDTTIADLKREAGIPAQKPLTYNDGTDTYDLTDRDTVGAIPEGSTVAPLPDSGRLFG